MDSSVQDESDKTNHIIKLIETLFNNGDDNDKNRLVRKIDKLSNEDKSFINQKAKTLINIDDDMKNTIKSKNLITSLNKLQMNILTLFLMSRIPECSDEINLILKNFNEKIANVNEIIKYNLDDINTTNSSDEDLQTSASKESLTEQEKKQPKTPDGSPTDQENEKDVLIKKLKEENYLKQQKLYEEEKKLKEKTETCNIPLKKNEEAVIKNGYKINSLDELYNYITDFNKEYSIDNRTMDTTPIEPSIKNNFLSKIDNPEYKRIVEETLNGKYTYKRLFSLIEKIKAKYQDISK
jgi:hypothetical protein